MVFNMSDNNNASPNESWWVGNFEEGDEWNMRVRQNLQHDAHIRIVNDNREEKNTEGDVGRNETANEEGDDANNRACSIHLLPQSCPPTNFH